MTWKMLNGVTKFARKWVVALQAMFERVNPSIDPLTEALDGDDHEVVGRILMSRRFLVVEPDDGSDSPVPVTFTMGNDLCVIVLTNRRYVSAAVEACGDRIKASTTETAGEELLQWIEAGNGVWFNPASDRERVLTAASLPWQFGSYRAYESMLADIQTEMGD